MKKYLGFILLCLIINSAYTQDNFSVHFAQTYSWFKFTDSDGNTDKNMTTSIRYSYALNYNKILSSGLYIRPELGYKNFGAGSSLNAQKLDWSLHYLDFNIGGGYIFTKIKFQPFIGISFYTSYLYKAEQSTGNAYIDMIENDAIKTIDYGINSHAGVIYAFTDMASVFLEYRYTTGLNQLEPNSETGQTQKLYNRAMSVHFGLAFKIPQK
ncbi:MAG: PorT family protein [Bacteroidia bacterium]|nr:PorT family protein [Bacteroidia bacterium]